MQFAAVAVSAALAVSACSSGAGTASSTVLTIASTTDVKAAVEEAIAAFEATHPGVEVKPTYAETDALVTTLRTQLSSGTAPDVLTVWPGYGNAMGMRILQDNGYLADLSDQSFVPQIPAGLDSLLDVDGKTWVLPLTVVGIGAIYNEQAVEAAGATIPTTFSEVLQFCDAAADAGKVAFALGNQAAWVTQLVNYALVPTTVFQKDPDFDARMAAGEATFVGSGWETSFATYLRMNEAGCFTADPLGTSFEATISQVAAGDALAVVQVTSTLPGIREQAADGTTFNMFALPATENPDETWMSAALGFSLGVNAASKN
ncbi:MAG: ABC transporter substrate-binding protein, partial [Propionicimonas sp.]